MTGPGAGEGWAPFELVVVDEDGGERILAGGDVQAELSRFAAAGAAAEAAFVRLAGLARADEEASLQ